MLRVAALAAMAAGAGCSSSSSAAPSTFTEIYPLIFPQTTKAQCNFCHGLPPNDKSNGNLSMGSDKASAYAALTGKTSTSTTCPNKAFIVPGQPDQSLFYAKLTSPQCGGRMPLGGDPLTSAQLDMVKSWIEAGAKDD
jgi:hypothetical protein